MTALRPFLRLWLSFLVLAVAMPALGHGLTVFALVDGETLVIESTFSSGRVPQVGMVRIYDGYDELIHEAEVTGESAMRLPLPDWSTGLKVEVDVGDGHDGYWILTPADVRRQQAEPE